MSLFSFMPDGMYIKVNRIKNRYLGLFRNSWFKPKISKTYRNAFGRKLPWDNVSTFNEKIQWLKIYDATPQKTLLADKYLVREWVAGTIGEEYLVPLLGVWDRFDDIDFDKLPDRFVLKCNHGSGYNVIVKDKDTLDYKKTKSFIDRCMSKNYAYIDGEMHYKNITPKIIAEEYLEAADGLKDYRFFCFDGEPKQIWVDLHSGTPEHIRSVFDMGWHKVDIVCTWPDGGETLAAPPQNLPQMIEMAKKLSRGFCFVRVDFFEVNGRLYMGEMTFTPMDGLCKFEPEEWDHILGSWLKLPDKPNS